MHIKLLSGIEVSASDFSFGYTYGGLLEGTPNEKFNRKIVERTNYPSNWGARKTLKLSPSEEEIKRGLKPAHYAVWLSSTPINPDYHGSELVVIWFDFAPKERSIKEIIQAGVEAIDWKSNAKDFYY